MEGLLQELIDLVKQTEPQLLEIAVRQVAVNAWRSLLFCLIVAIAVPISISWMRGYWRRLIVEESDTEIPAIFIFVISSIDFFLVAFAVAFLFSAIGYLANPEYYAIQVLMELVK